MKDNTSFSNDTEREEWFLAALDADSLPAQQLLEVLSSLHAGDQQELALSWAELLQDELRNRDDADSAIDLLCLRETWTGNDPDFRQTCVDALSDTLRAEGAGKQFVKDAGFETGIPTTEALRRFKTLTLLKPGLLCYDKTWGAGAIDRVDTFYAKVTIDFSRKPGHEMSFAYAAESLELLEDDHILAIHHREPQKLQELAKSQPAELAKLAIRSYGPLNVVQLMESLIDTGMPEADWKPFWSRARTGLKADDAVNFPASRTDPISLRTSVMAYDEAWLTEFEKQRDVRSIAESLEDLASGQGAASLGSGFHDRIADRVMFLVSGAESKRPDLVARSLVAIAHLGIQSSHFDAAGYARRYLSFDPLIAATDRLPMKSMKPFLAFLRGSDSGSVLPELLLQNLHRMHLALLAEAIDFLHDSGLRDETMQALRGHLRRRSASPEMLAWLCQSLDLPEKALDTTVNALLLMVVDALEQPADKRHTKARRQLRQYFERKKWLADAMGRMSSEQNHDLAERINTSTAWPPDEKAAVLARLLVIEPGLQEALQAATPEHDAASQPRITSWRSYNERVRRLEKMQKEDIPQNAKALAHARSFGDLKENHAYKEAKQHQAILLNRRDSLAQDLKHIKGSSFDHVSFEVVAPGTHVTLELHDGSRIEYSILGEWDSDEELGIIACGTRLAQSLLGHGPGSEVQIPGDSGDAPCRIQNVSQLPADVRNWIDTR